MNRHFHAFRLNWYDYAGLGLLSLIGVGCITLTLLARMKGIDLFATTSENDFEALYFSLGMSGVLSIGFVGIILLLLRDRRSPDNDRRQSRRPIDFPDRRSGTSRRRAASVIDDEPLFGSCADIPQHQAPITVETIDKSEP